LDGSQYYGTLANVPEPDATAPTASPAYDIQVYIHNSFLLLEEIVRLTEDDERDTIKREIEKRKTRLGAPPLRKLIQDVESEVYGSSKVAIINDRPFHLANLITAGETIRGNLEPS
jgi:superkiller protein 3